MEERGQEGETLKAVKFIKNPLRKRVISAGHLPKRVLVEGF